MNTRLIVVVVLGILAAGCRQPETPPDPVKQRAANRHALFDAIKPVKLSNCDFERIGDKHDGGYVVCKNLLSRAESIYSYGISATDNFGCSLSARLGKPVHQYDCFNVTRPACAGAAPMFHEECVGAEKATIEGRPFDTVEAQIGRNGDAGKRLIVKMDVEGSEWESFLEMPESVMQQIDQLTVEFHGVEEKDYASAINRLRKVFHVVNVHYNNWTCSPDVKPLQATTFEVLFVNKGLGVVDQGGHPVVPNPLDAPNNWMRPDCQTTPAEYYRP